MRASQTDEFFNIFVLVDAPTNGRGFCMHALGRYAAGQYVIVDLLPAGAATGAASDAVPPEDIVKKLVEKAEDVGSELFQTRILGQLQNVVQIDGIGVSSERMILSDIQKRGSDLQQTSFLQLVIMLFFLGGILLATGLVLGICYGTCQGTRDASLEEKPKKTKRADKGTDEEKVSLAASVEAVDHTEPVDVAPAWTCDTALVLGDAAGKALLLSEADVETAGGTEIDEVQARWSSSSTRRQDASFEKPHRTAFVMGGLDGLD